MRWPLASAGPRAPPAPNLPVGADPRPETAASLAAIETTTADTVRTVFADAGFAHLTGAVTVEPYRRGSAFLIETLNVD